MKKISFNINKFYTRMENYEIFPENNEKNNVNLTKTRSNIDLTWSKMTYKIKDKIILDELDGFSLSGQVTAIMGSSGAGKTSLLNALSCRIESSWKSTVSGVIYANGIKLTNNLFGKIAAYVMQQDILMETLTPKGFILINTSLF